MKNIKKRGRDYESEISEDYLQQIQNGYFEFIKSRTDLTFVVLDMNKIDFVENPEDYQSVKNTIFNTEYKPGMNMVLL